MKRRPAFDASWLTEVGWFTDRPAPAFDVRSLSAYADRVYDFGRAEHAWTEMCAR